MKSITFMILGDAHLDSDFKQDISDRRREMREAFDEAINTCAKYSLDFLFIPGDLFDKRSQDQSTVNYVKNAFAGLKKTSVVIAPGNHDPYTVDSSYNAENWPDNVYIFNKKFLTYFEFNGEKSQINTVPHDMLYSEAVARRDKRGVRVYGAAFDGHFIKDSMLHDESGKLPRLQSGFVNVLLMHGTLNKNNLTVNPLDESAVKECGFDISVIGGTHSKRISDNIFSSGVLYPRNFTETGDTGVILGEITEDGEIRTDFMPINKMYYDVMKFDVTDVSDLSAFALANEIKKLGKEGTSLKVILCGTTSYSENVDTDALREALLGYFTIIEVEDRTTKSDNIKILSQEASPRGIFVRKILERTGDRDKQEFTISETDEAIFTALKAFSHKEETGK